ncbi:MAG: hypothetical protein CFH35_00579, partial [Alphaproteobacteria bacterium MarineAlpha9_Bin5]
MKLTETKSVFAGTLAVAFGAAMFASVATAGNITQERLNNSEAEPENWLHHHGNYETHRYSGLSEINAGNVHELKVAWTYAMGDTHGGG